MPGVTHLEFWTSKRRIHLLKLTKEHIVQAQLLSDVFAYARMTQQGDICRIVSQLEAKMV